MTAHIITKNVPENDIYSLHLLIFDANGDLVGRPFYLENADQSPIIISTNEAFSLPVTKSADAKYKNCTAYMIANICKISTQSASFFNNITDIDELKSSFAIINSADGFKNPTAILSIGKKTGIDISIQGSIPMTLTRAMAAIRFNVDTAFTENYPLTPSFVITNWEVRHIPSQTYITPNSTDFSAANTTSYTDFTTTGNTLSFYMWENRCGTRGALVAGKNAQPTNCPENNRQCYKPSYAPANASYVLLRGVFTDHNGNTKNVTYTFYLGADNYQDYNILRNNRYTYNVTINGATRSSISVFVEKYDARVDIDGLDVTLLEGTRIDSHYDNRTLDIKCPNGTTTITVLSSTGADVTESFWVKISANPVASYGADTQSEKTTLTYTTTTTSQNKRTYILIKENTDPTPRTAILRIKHTAPDGTVKIQNHTLRQAGLIKVGTLGVETYEEYINIYDPTSPYNTIVQGLQWGYYAQSNVYDLNGDALGSNGRNNTFRLIDSEEHCTPFTSWERYSLYQNYAARYCYNKNRRNTNGTIIETKWYLPSIKELNTITASGAIATTSPGAINPNSIYWSSSCPTRIEVSTLNSNIPSTWQWLVNILISIFGNNTDAANVAKASKAGLEYFNTNTSGSITARAYPTRNTLYNVRCVRGTGN
ncbi:MAG: DUF4906 domain-containing protein [Flavobacteriales bacterium]|nr:DUF4906 domain-containing protein [Flavobacteriales bacterium]